MGVLVLEAAKQLVVLLQPLHKALGREAARLLALAGDLRARATSARGRHLQRPARAHRGEELRQSG